MIAINGFGRIGRYLLESVDGKAVVIDPHFTCESGNITCVQNVYMLPEVPDVIIDFSSHKAIADLLRYAVASRVPLVIGTTGHTAEEREAICRASHSIPIFMSANMSYGMALFREHCVRMVGALRPRRIGIHEIHRADKVDAPSGTAIMLAQALAEAGGKSGWCLQDNGDAYVTVSYERRGDVVGVHSVLLEVGMERITLTHEALDRRVFAEGAMHAAAFLRGKEHGLYGIEDLGRAYAIRQD